MSSAPFDIAHKHFVALWFVDEDDSPILTPSTRPDAGFFLSGVLVSVEGSWFILVAKHCFNQIIERLRTKRRRIKACRILDHVSPDARHRYPIPLAYNDIWKIKLGKGDDFDVGAIPVPRNTRHLLSKNGMVALPESACLALDNECDEHWLFGILTDSVRMATHIPGASQVPFAVGFYAMPVQRLRSKPDRFGDHTAPYFYGQLLGDWTSRNGNPIPRDLEGMSGGPVFAIRRSSDGQERYWLAGIQSSWLPESEQVAAASAEVASRSLADGLQLLRTQGGS